MSESGAAVDRGNDLEDDCPVCLEPLPPFWDTGRRVLMICCGGAICGDCDDKRDAYLSRAVAEGTFGREEEQLASTCPLCRTKRPKLDDVGRMLMGRFEKGELPLTLYLGLASKYLQGVEGVERNAGRGMEILMLGAEKGDPNCQHELGIHYRNGHGVPKSTTEAKRLWLAATEQGHAKAECCLAAMARHDGNDPDYLRYLLGSASKGYNEACYNLGVACYHGKCGLRRSLEEAIRVLTPAAEKGDPNSMRLLGFIMCNPDPHLPQPPPSNNPSWVKGMHWIRRAAETGDEDLISQLKTAEEWASGDCFRCNEKAPSGEALLRCSRCRAAWYCSKDCQVQHWRAGEGGHKQFCIKWE